MVLALGLECTVLRVVSDGMKNTLHVKKKHGAFFARLGCAVEMKKIHPQSCLLYRIPRGLPASIFPG